MSKRNKPLTVNQQIQHIESLGDILDRVGDEVTAAQFISFHPLEDFLMSKTLKMFTAQMGKGIASLSKASYPMLDKDGNPVKGVTQIHDSINVDYETAVDLAFDDIQLIKGMMPK